MGCAANIPEEPAVSNFRYRRIKRLREIFSWYKDYELFNKKVTKKMEAGLFCKERSARGRRG
jgi:hypothetical protein